MAHYAHVGVTHWSHIEMAHLGHISLWPCPFRSQCLCLFLSLCLYIVHVSLSTFFSLCKLRYSMAIYKLRGYSTIFTLPSSSPSMPWEDLLLFSQLPPALSLSHCLSYPLFLFFMLSHVIPSSWVFSLSFQLSLFILFLSPPNQHHHQKKRKEKRKKN